MDKRKFFLCILTVLFLAAAFSGCGGSAAPAAASGQPVKTESAAQTTGSEDPVQTAAAAPASTGAEPFSKEDMAAVIEGKTFRVRTDSAGLLALLGSGYEYTEAISCVYDGKDKVFKYKDISVNTVPIDGKDVIEMITLSGGGYATARGIKQGDTKEAVLKAYGDKYFDDGYLTYSTTNDPEDIQAERIQFLMEEGIVREICIYSPSY